LQLVGPRNFPQTRNTILLHEILPRNHANIRILVHTTPTCTSPTRPCRVMMSEDLAYILDLHHWPPQHSFAMT